MQAHLSPAWPASAARTGLRGGSARHPRAIAMAGLLAVAAPLKFFVGFLSISRPASMRDLAEVSIWWSLYAGIFWFALLAAGRFGERIAVDATRLRRFGTWVVLAFACAAAANFLTATRARVLVEYGLVQGALPMHLYAMALSFTLAMLYFVHLERTRVHERAAARLAAAQSAQREARRRQVRMELQATQARIDPALLFDMLQAVQDAYATDPPRAERLLDELIAFLRAALPRVRTVSSSVAREAELGRAYVRLLALARGSDGSLHVEISRAAMHARFPPGALLPLLADAMRAGDRDATLQAGCEDGRCRVTLRLPASPAASTLATVGALLRETDGPSADLSSHAASGECRITIQVPHEPA